MFTTDASGETVDEWPSGPGLTRFIPISVEDSTEWLLAISGGTVDVAAEGPLRVLGHLLGALLTNLHRNGIERMRRRLSTIFAFGDAPFDATAQIVLDAIAAEMDATEASVTIFYPPDPTPILRFGRGSGEVPFVEAGSATMTADHISVGVAASAGVTMVLDLLRADGPFGHHAARFARAAATHVGIWVSGILIKPRDVQMREGSQTSARFDDRAASYIDRLGRLSISGAVVVLVPERGEVTGQALDEALDILHERLRPNDTMGVIDAGGAAVLLPDVTHAVAGSVVARLMQASRRRGLESARVGLATFAAAAETLGSVINRALMNAGGGPLFHA